METIKKELGSINKKIDVVTVKLTDGYLEYFLDERLIYDIEADRLAEHLPNMREKNWFTPELERMSNALSRGVQHG